MSLTLKDLKQMPEIVRVGIELGWIRRRAPLLKPVIAPDEAGARMRVNKARLRAERREEDTSDLPPRVRRKPNRNGKAKPQQ